MIKPLLGPAKMKIGHHWSFRLFVMAALCLTLSADDACDKAIKVRRNTVYEASPGEQLKIACNVSACDNLPPNITWFKLETGFTKLRISSRFKTEWTRTNDNEGIYFLIFNKVLNSDSGQYQCQYGNEVSHNIHVTVTDIATNNGTLQNVTSHITNFPTPSPDNNKQLWLYLYTAAGIVGFVIIVIVISVLSMRGCSGEPKNNNRRENQYMDIPMIEQSVHHPNDQALPRASPCGTPSHRTSRKKKTPCAPTQRDVYDQIEGTRNAPLEGGSSVVYAALNHEHLAGASPRPRAVVDERSEYAAIRVS